MRPLPLRVFLVLVTFFGAVRASSAHPIHRSIAEATYQPSSRILEVALRLFADDFETTLSAREKKKISLEKTPAADFDRVAHAYLAERFVVKTAAGMATTRRWIGREFKDAANECWFYFEVALPEGIEGVTILHAALTDQFRDQLNSVVVHVGARKQTLFFLPTHREKTVRFPPE